jgi:hypothetical protein
MGRARSGSGEEFFPEGRDVVVVLGPEGAGARTAIAWDLEEYLGALDRRAVAISAI